MDRTTRKRGGGACWTLAAALMAIGAAVAEGEEPAAGPGPAAPAVVYLADGTSVPLQEWSFAYEYRAAPSGVSWAQAKSSQKESREIWFGGKSVSVAGGTLEIEYEVAEVAAEGESGASRALVAQAKRFVLTDRRGEKSRLKPKAPSRDRLLDDSQKGFAATAVMLDLRGRSLAGAARRFCLVAFSVHAECRPAQAERVVRIVFPE